ncbi:hypothetical protein BGZ73_005097 [Actinomortierella ambigua]|nr:hypothetical protein BGZ73_005097 [Actinomortierella ambigua]
MCIIRALGLLALASSVLADVTFNVVAFPDTATNKYAVEVDDQIFPLSTSKDIFPLWTANVPGASAFSSYRYVQLDQQGSVINREEFDRFHADSSATATANEFFGRQTTFSAIPKLKQLYEDARPPAATAWDNRQVGTIHLTTDADQFEDILQHPTDKQRKPIKAAFRFINADTVYSAPKAKLSVSGNSSRRWTKVSLKVRFDEEEGDTFFGRPIIKLRAEATDSTMLREKLYVDLLNAVGVPVYQGSYVRVYVNGEAHGLFLMVEDVEEPFLKTTVHQGRIQDANELGSLYQMSIKEAPMEYQGPSDKDYHPRMYMIKRQMPGDEHMQQWIAFMKDLNDWDPTSPDGVEFWDERLDLDGFLRSMALEYLTGAWDGFWWRGHNFFMYFNPEKKVWQFLPTDFDHTFSNSNRPDVLTAYRNFGQVHLDKKLTDHPLVTKLIFKNKEINEKFEDILSTLTKEVFNAKVMNELIDAYELQIQDDVSWDYDIDRSIYPGKPNNHWDIGYFHKSIKGHNIKKQGLRGLKPWIAVRSQMVAPQLGRFPG